jgi:hypothetical protein
MAGSDGISKNSNLPMMGLHESGSDGENSAFSGAIGASQCHTFTGLHRERDIGGCIR